VSESILVVEDDPTVATNVARGLSRDGHAVTAVGTCKEALAELAYRSFDVVLLDLRLPDGDGLEVLDEIPKGSPETFTLVMTAYASIESAIDALRRGAHDYVLKPLALADLRAKVERVARNRQIERENVRLRAIVRGDSDAIAALRRGGQHMARVADLVDRVAPTQANVLVTGESGTGKDLVARALHERSTRGSGPFVAFSVGAIPEALVEAQLFGYERGAHFGADAACDGLFRAASGGTLLIDDVGELSALAQTKLLRAVETKEILPLGADHPRRVDVRVVAATHRDLAAGVRQGTFREDLFYRLNVVTVDIPPLRQRKSDIATLARELLERHARTYQRPVVAFTEDAIACLERYAWPGNVRELSNAIERATIVCDGDAITAAHLPPVVSGMSPPASQDGGSSGAPEPLLDPNLERATATFQREHVRRVLERTNGSRDDAARLLGLSPATLYRYLQKLGLKGFRADDEDARSTKDDPS
jgi:DNA-binding NtrC family response regulator